MSNTQKRGFRLHWGAERRPEAGAGDIALDATGNPVGDVDGNELGEGPFHLADATRTPTTDAAPAASDVPEDSAEAAMMDAEIPSAPFAAEAPPDAPPQAMHDAGPEAQGSTASPQTTGTGGAWPDTDRRSAERPFARLDAASGGCGIEHRSRSD